MSDIAFTESGCGVYISLGGTAIYRRRRIKSGIERPMGFDEIIDIALVDEITKLRAELEALRKDAEWISVEDRLPEFDHDVLIYRKDGLIMMADFPGEFYTYRDTDGYSKELDVTHWKPLPPAPSSEMKGWV